MFLRFIELILELYRQCDIFLSFTASDYPFGIFKLLLVHGYYFLYVGDKSIGFCFLADIYHNDWILSLNSKDMNCSYVDRGRRDSMVVRFTTTCTISACRRKSREFELPSWLGVLDTTLSDKVCQWLGTGWWFSPCTPVSSTNTSDL
jgi:hypothetical protein